MSKAKNALCKTELLKKKEIFLREKGKKYSSCFNHTYLKNSKAGNLFPRQLKSMLWCWKSYFRKNWANFSCTSL